ncbi:MAG: XrtA system polysaccharide deacetylase [Bryobacteraceae bacterium]
MRVDESDRIALPDAGPTGPVRCIFTVDVEDWFHILDLASAPPVDQWAVLPSRLERNFLRLLDMVEEAGSSCTCFFLGWVARRFPSLVREAARRGHEVASHGYAHRLAYTMTPDEFFRDARQARLIIEEVAGCPVSGYRAAGFSLTSRTPWFHEKLVEAGYWYDSSLFPARRNHGGLLEASLEPGWIQTAAGPIAEFPVSVVRLMGFRLCLFGGGYFRLAPLGLIARMAQRVLAEGRPVIFYLHPREIDPEQPRLPMPVARRFRSYVNLAGTAAKLRSLLAQLRFTSIAYWMQEAGWTPAGVACPSR